MKFLPNFWPIALLAGSFAAKPSLLWASCSMIRISGLFPKPGTRSLGADAIYSRPDKDYSLMDCISVQTMRREG